MKIVFTGGGTGGHFYPIIAVAENIYEISKERKLIEPQLFYFAPAPYDPEALFRNGIEHRHIAAGKIRRYFSPLNVFDFFKTGWGIVQSFWKLFWIYPDVVFSKGGYASFPVVFAARFLRIPIILHESDAVPGRVNAWAAKYARKIAISYAEAAEHFPKEKVVHTGNPVRSDIHTPATDGAFEFLELDEALPVLLILGGSQGAENINNAILNTLPQLLEKYQIIHQTGEANAEAVRNISSVILKDNPNAGRYKPFGYLNTLALRMAAGAASIAITRAGSALFEIALWGLPSIVIPIPESVSHDQRTNAFTYARHTGAVVIEEYNLTASVLRSEIDRVLTDQELQEEMSRGAREFARPDAGESIANALLDIALSHEPE